MAQIISRQWTAHHSVMHPAVHLTSMIIFLPYITEFEMILCKYTFKLSFYIHRSSKDHISY